VAGLVRYAGSAAVAGVARSIVAGVVAAGTAMVLGRVIADQVSGAAIAANVGVAVAATAVTVLIFAAIVSVADGPATRGLLRSVRRG
jgi:hypothetical protein